ncbi:hypothetical protein [Streptomyces sp. NPDC051211]|uniref:hypothetical protein n=1 Tax=Streptomyces sp. NPDC051211 TaxID=3154643 RepID=UPI00344DFEA5
MKRLQEEFGISTLQWTDEQHVAWRDAWEAGRVPFEEMDMALTYHAETLGLERSELEAMVHKATGHVPLPDGQQDT